MALKPLAELRKMSQHQLNSIRKEDLIQSILSAPEPDDANLAVVTQLTALIAEVADIKKALTSPDSAINRQVRELQDQVTKQQEVIARQQRFLEDIDRKARECNLVLLGIPEEQESLEGATTDAAKIQKVWTTTGSSVGVRTSRRLGRAGGRRRPVLVTVASREDRDAVLERAKHLKEAGETFKRIFVKKDTHPAVREEWKRLKDAEKTEKEKPENADCNIYINYKERQLYRDREVIDRFSLMSF